jgi:hypothetical protein
MKPPDPTLCLRDCRLLLAILNGTTLRDVARQAHLPESYLRERLCLLFGLLSLYAGPEHVPFEALLAGGISSWRARKERLCEVIQFYMLDVLAEGTMHDV